MRQLPQGNYCTTYSTTYCTYTMSVSHPACYQVYHLSCLGLATAPRTTSRWVCPWHSCLYCDKLARACPDRVLYRCRQCPYSYCKDCMPVGKKPQLDDPPTDSSNGSSLEKDSFLKHNFPVPQDVRWIICPECSTEQRYDVLYCSVGWFSFL